MAETRTISKTVPERESMNYAALRAAGISYLQSLEPKLWNDYNYHDPGVTILEQLCYAITDLGYRTNFPMKDLLAANPDSSPETKEIKAFFSAREILTCNPVTVSDYRKLILDVPGVANVWLEKSKQQEQSIYADLEGRELTYEPPSGESVNIQLNGLYKVLLEFGYSEENGDLNDPTVTGNLLVESGDLSGLEVEITVQFPYWEDEDVDWNDAHSIFNAIKGVSFDVEEQVAGYSVDFGFNESGDFEALVYDLSGLDPVYDSSLSAELTSVAQALIYNGATGSEPLPTGTTTLVAIYQQRIAEVREVIANVWQKLHAHRNLCEDFFSLKSLRIEEIGLCADLELETDADIETVAAEIYFRVGRFLAPPINFYTLDEMLDKTWTDSSGNEQPYTSNEIFQGPALQHGFVDEAELEAAVRQETIHVSDLINIIMDIDGVYAVKSIQIANYPPEDSGITQRSVEWCLPLAYELNYVPRLSVEHSRLRFYKDDIPYLGDSDEIDAELEKRVSEAGSGKPTESLEFEELDMEVPKGTYRHLEKYTSFQEQFPEVYGIGRVGLSPGSSDKRKAQANQLKGFLMHFDQLLANYLAQLAHIKELFSMNANVSATYFNQPLYELPHVQRLYTSFMQSNGFDADSAQSDASNWNTAWELFTADEHNDYRQALANITESETEFLQRRSGFLDHLMARFAEQFTDYVLVMQGITGKKASEELNEDKLALLQNYPAISRDRGRGYDQKYIPPTGENPVWNTDNVSGFVRRLSRLVGIQDISRRYVSCMGDMDVRIEEETDGWYVRIFVATGDLIMEDGPFPDPAAVQAMVDEKKPEFIANTVGWKVVEDTSTGGGFRTLFVDANDAETLVTLPWETEARAEEVGEAMMQQIAPECDSEGMHLVEHILLRPRFNESGSGGTIVDQFLPVSLEPDCYCAGTEDPWSFRASLILPYWPERFRNMDFRKHLERMARQEAPAHVTLKICWIDKPQMRAFELAWQSWLTENNKQQPNKADLSEKLNTLIDVLATLRNVYPSTTLHDCEDDGDGSAPAMLGSARLGTF